MMKNYAYATKEEALTWIGSYFSKHPRLVARQIEGTLPNNKECVQEYLIKTMGESEILYTDGQYLATESEVQVYSKGKDSVWKFSWEQVAEKVVQINSMYYSDALPAPMDDTYFDVEITYTEGLGILTHWLLRCFKFNIDYLLKNKMIEFSVEAITEKLISCHEKKFFTGKYLKRISDNSIELDSCNTDTDINTDFIKVNSIYTKNGAIAATFNTTNNGVIVQTTRGSVMEYSWNLIAKCIYENKKYLIEHGPELSLTSTAEVSKKVEDSFTINNTYLETQQEQVLEMNFTEVSLKPGLLGSQTLAQLSFL